MKFLHIGPERPLPEVTLQQINGRRCYTTLDGQQYPSITSILSSIPNPGLERWKRTVGFAEAKEIARKAADRGTRLHYIVTEYLSNNVLDLSGKSIPLFNQVRHCLDKISNIHILETPLCSARLRMAGTVDCIAEYKNELSVIDFKTSTKTKKKEWVDSYFMQASAYSIMYEELTGRPIDNLVLIIAVENSVIPHIFIEPIDKYIDKLIATLRYYRRQENANNQSRRI